MCTLTRGVGVHALVTLAALTLGAAHARADDVPTEPVAIDVVGVNGTGCPLGAGVAIVPTNTAVSVTYSSDFVARIGPGAIATDARKNCQINLLVHTPPGFQYALVEADYIGSASIVFGATASERASYFFQGQTPTATFTHTFTGPLNDDWQTLDAPDITQVVFSPCGVERNLNINTDLVVNRGTSDAAAASSIALTASRRPAQTVFRLGWRRCS